MQRQADVPEKGEMMAKHWYVELKEVGHGVLTTEYVGDKSREDVIKWFGLDQPDVEWYKLRCKEE